MLKRTYFSVPYFSVPYFSVQTHMLALKNKEPLLNALTPILPLAIAAHVIPG
jgi:hypothetical protein